MKSIGMSRKVAAAVASLALLTACGGGNADGGSDPGVTDDSILLGSHLPLTGPAAPGLQDLGPAWKAYFDHVNANGGVHGRDIEVKYYDDAYNPTTTGQVVRKLVQQDKVFALIGGVGTPTHSTVLDFVKANNVPDLFVSSGGTTWNQPDKYPTTFGWQPSGVVEGKIIAEFVNEQFADSTVCAFGQDGELGETGVEGFEEVLGEDAYTLKQTYTPSDPAIEPQIIKLRDAGCEVVTFYGISAFAALAMNTASEVGFTPTFIGGSNNNDYGTLAALVNDASLLEGFHAIEFLPPPQQGDNTWNAEFQAIWEEYGTDTPYGSFIEYGMSQAYTFTQVLQEVGPDLTRDKLVETLKTMDFDPNPGYAPLRYSEDDHSGYSGGKLSVVRNGVFEPIGDTYSTTEGADVPVEKVTTPPADAPTDAIPN